jgi:hypothetical protein
MEKGDLDNAIKVHSSTTTAAPQLPKSTQPCSDDMLKKVDQLNEEIKMLVMKYSSPSTASSLSQKTEPLIAPRDYLSAYSMSSPLNTALADYSSAPAIGLAGSRGLAEEPKGFDSYGFSKINVQEGKPTSAQWNGYSLGDVDKEEFGLAALEKRLAQAPQPTQDDSAEFEPLDKYFDTEIEHTEPKSELKGFGENSLIPPEPDCLDITHPEDWIRPEPAQADWKGESAFNKGKLAVIDKYFSTQEKDPVEQDFAKPISAAQPQLKQSNALHQEDYYQEEDTLYIERIKNIVNNTKKDIEKLDNKPQPSPNIRQPIEIMTSPTIFKLGNNIKEVTPKTSASLSSSNLQKRPQREGPAQSEQPLDLLKNMKAQHKGPISVQVEQPAKQLKANEAHSKSTSAGASSNLPSRLDKISSGSARTEASGVSKPAGVASYYQKVASVVNSTPKQQLGVNRAPQPVADEDEEDEDDGFCLKRHLKG